MISKTQGYVPVTGLNGVYLQPNCWLGAATSDLTKVYGQGITSIARNAAGKYTITFDEIGYQTPVVTFAVLDTATGNKWTVRVDDFDASAKTLIIYCVSTTTETDLPTTAKLVIDLMQCDSTVPQ